MGKLVVSEFLTLDGVMEDPGGAEGSRYGGWAFKVARGKEADTFKRDELFASEALLMGRTTYDGFAQVWPTVPKDEAGYTERMNSIPKYVVSPDAPTKPWDNSHFITDNAMEEVAKLKSSLKKDLLVFGSGMLVHGLIQAGLVDEIRLMVWPIVVGGGKRLFESLKMDVELVESKTYDSGVLVLVYKPKNN
jgi:dihydrofolate reductase